MKYLIAGLGNIGSDYENTRHNIGFEVCDALAAEFEVPFKTESLGDVAEFRHKGRTFVLLKPSTYMNRSGKAVRYWLQKKNINEENLLVILDDLQLPFGRIRIKPNGSDGGHNGLKDINQVLGHQKYPRLRIGIGSDFHKGQQVNYVLGEWSSEEKAELKDILKKSADCVKSFGTIGLERTMNFFNSK
ncbi:MAG: aminoacyl-tRNA hydrolase [Saprospiraceae bacterium]|nr:aminoacyl-tRNA hydrolase [Saprospiraceae bacterium]